MPVVLLQPGVHVEQVVLLRPQHAGERLAVDAAFVFGELQRRDPLIELVGLHQAGRHRLLEAGPEGIGAAAARRQPGPNDFEPPAGTSSTQCAAALVPVRSGLTAPVSPVTT